MKRRWESLYCSSMSALFHARFFSQQLRFWRWKFWSSREWRVRMFSARSTLICHGGTAPITAFYPSCLPGRRVGCRRGWATRMRREVCSSRRFYSGVAAGGSQPREALRREISFHALCVYWFYWGFGLNWSRCCQRAKRASLLLDGVLGVAFLRAPPYLCS